jgi:HEAT repeat protein
MEARIAQLKSQDTRTLLTDLNAADKFQAGLIRTVLKERGLTSDELVLGSKFTASDPQVRLNLVDDLQVLPARTARWWLKELLSDSDANVRLKALTALATTNDPELIGIAREVAVEDTDPRVSELATRIMRGTIKR